MSSENGKRGHMTQPFTFLQMSTNQF